MMNRYLMLTACLFVLMSSCKKETTAPLTIYGKWFAVNQHSKLYNSSGTLVDTLSKTKFTSDDFVDYGNDGSGYFSSSSTVTPSISLFTYTTKGISLIQLKIDNSYTLEETITVLTATNLVIHAEVVITDPDNVDQTDKEVDDYSYRR